MRKVLICLALICLLTLTSCYREVNVNPSDELINFPVIDIIISNEDYLTLLSNKIINYEVPCKISYNDKTMWAEIRAAGAGSRYREKWSYTIEIEDGKVFEGFTKFNFNCQTYDETMLRSLIALYAYRSAEVYDFMVKHYFLRINGKDHGLYLQIERIDESYFYRRQIPFWEVYKIGFGTLFTFSETNNPQFTIDKEIPDNNNYSTIKELIHACDTSDTEVLVQTFGKFLNLDQYLRYHAITMIINNMDAFNNNFLLFKRTPNIPFEVIPWDFDNALSHKVDVPLYGRNRLGEKILSNDSLRSVYKSFIKQFITNYYNVEKLFPMIDSLAETIREPYNLDPYLGNGRFDFNEEINKLKVLISNRISYIMENIDDL